MNTLHYNTYLDQVWGGWYGKCLGGAAGAPVEGFKRINDVKDFADIMNPNLPNDDLDIQLLWLEVLEKKGPFIDSCTLADAWLEKCWYPFSEYGYFMKNYRRGIKPPYSGTFNNPFFKEGMGCPIRSEIWGFTFPGQPEKAAQYAGMDAALDHGDNSLWAEQFLAVMESMLFFENDIRKLINIGLEIIPEDSKLSRCIKMVMDCHVSGNYDWMSARNKVINMFGHPDFTNVTQNLGFIAIALLYGQCDLRKTINIALRCGYDADCTCATAGAVVGGILGFSGMKNELASLICDHFVIGIDVARRSNSIKDLAEDTCSVGIAILKDSDSEINIIGIPQKMTMISWHKPEQKPFLSVIYRDKPAIGLMDTTRFDIIVKNNWTKEFKGTVVIGGIPGNWVVLCEKFNICLCPGQTLALYNAATIPEGIGLIHNTNLLSVNLLNNSGEEVDSISFGIAGAQLWKAYGPFFEQLEKEPDYTHPSPHGDDCILPTVECMVNNAVYLEKQYINEAGFDFTSITPDAIINAYEDLIPVEDLFKIEGQCCFYLVQELISPEDREVWVVIGNNDGFKLWVNSDSVLERDEIRYWTPYNNSELVKLKKGSNKVVLKLLRRTESLKFSCGFRKYEGQHWHRKHWYVDFSTILSEKEDV